MGDQITWDPIVAHEIVGDDVDILFAKWELRHLNIEPVAKGAIPRFVIRR